MLHKRNIKLGTMGCKALDAQSKGEKHKRYANSQTTTVPIQMFSAPLSTASANNNVMPALVSSGACTCNAFSTFSPAATLKAEMLWVLQTRQHSYTSNRNMSSIFRAMFPDSECAKHLAVARTKPLTLLNLDLLRTLKESFCQL